jgi:hypothetical protein
VAKISGEEGRVEFQEEVLASQQKFFASAVAQKKSPFIKVVHGLTKYFNGDVANPSPKM